MRLAWVAAQAIRGYQIFLRGMLPASCRFAPSCSEYARQALLGQGLLRGGWLGLRRIARCHPWNPGGYDPLPIERPRG